MSNIQTAVDSKQRQFCGRYQFGSPRLRSRLREECKRRVRETRSATFDRNRISSHPTANNIVSKILREELAGIGCEIELQEKIYQDILEEWWTQQIEDEEKYFLDIVDDVAFCPMCQKSLLHKSDNIQLQCECGTIFQFDGSIQEFRMKLEDTINVHKQSCSQLLELYVEEDSLKSRNLLNAMCEDCDYFVCLS